MIQGKRKEVYVPIEFYDNAEAYLASKGLTKDMWDSYLDNPGEAVIERIDL